MRLRTWEKLTTHHLGQTVVGSESNEFVRKHNGWDQPNILGSFVLEFGIRQSSDQRWNEAELEYV